MRTPTTTTIGPMIDHVVVLLIGLPPTTPNPCNAHSRPNNATTTPSPTMAIRMTKTLNQFGVKLLSTARWAPFGKRYVMCCGRIVHGITAHNASSVPAHALSDGAE